MLTKTFGTLIFIFWKVLGLMKMMGVMTKSKYTPIHFMMQQLLFLMRKTHQTIKKVQQDVEALRFNTAISQMMIFTNLCIKEGSINQNSAESFIRVLSPFAPHISEEIWSLLGHSPSIADQPYPEFNEEYLKEDVFEYPVSFNGKLRFKIKLPLSMTDGEIKSAVKTHEAAQKWLRDGNFSKIIIVFSRDRYSLLEYSLSFTVSLYHKQ